ncbi:SURF1 family cytochrome oxidase biogenesis protein [Erythrobacter sp.]|jgi:surfeit locus 1 family protein|uniref:SURF1 family cytochrome oxidase biogenesis protein n=1 Tax=Erythrobacter sp. TaxID=1042 RepID=UPI002EC149E2|nr:SURF1 family cytochrome oxidase biogenesis protein [Erythrobacter sp.]
MKRLPVLPTILVLAAVATMIGLGIWQLGRMDEKAALIAQYEAALAETETVRWPSPAQYEESLFRLTRIDCETVRGIDSIGGKSANGRSGWVHVARCEHSGQGVADVTIGWSRAPEVPDWQGGLVTGRLAPYGDNVRLIASEPQAGLEPLAAPDPADLPNNHLAYAGQWFFFALTALVIYGFALRSRLRERK